MKPLSQLDAPPLPARFEDIRAGRPYLLSSAPVRTAARRVVSIVSLLAIDIGGLVIGLYGALALRAFLFEPKPVLWGILWRDGAATAPGLKATLKRTTLTLTFGSVLTERQVLLVGTKVVRGSVPRFASAAALRRAKAGWAPVAAPFPGVLLKVGDRRRTVTLTVG